MPEGPFAIAKLFADKRMSVSDWVSAINPPGTDKYRASGEITRVIHAGANPVSWIEIQSSRKRRDFEKPEKFLLDAITLETPLQHAFDSVPLPRSYIEKLIFDLDRAGKIKITRGSRNEMLLNRI